MCIYPYVWMTMLFDYHRKVKDLSRSILFSIPKLPCRPLGNGRSLQRWLLML